MKHYTCRIDIRLEASELDKIDQLIFERKFKNRSQAIRAAITEYLNKQEAA
ncbi:MAG: ribbon-helix-helix domain-containing protein [Candidatus Bathyarchaeota archaeon]|nr:ribbon-helix-helix domain-containing protein [Candidatus Bathyarchaeota archaeon]MDD4325309.1 ribbon-helix-helix domain-containing protein [Candidatus Bathyarchaeota archaeon]MDT8781313.1 ribbon-helix-helix protein, CopG family [Candidatus Bathyarchaeota archaeon]